MKTSQMRAMSQTELSEELLKLRREQFNLRMQRATGQLAQPHEIVRVRKSIARLKTVMNEMARAEQGAGSES